jgi:hypothetical protein
MVHWRIAVPGEVRMSRPFGPPGWGKRYRDCAPTFSDLSGTCRAEGERWWVEALKCHRSQFYNPHTQRYDAIERFLAVARARGFALGLGYVHAFIARALLHIDDPFRLVVQ